MNPEMHYKCNLCLHNGDDDECEGCKMYSNYYPMSPSLAALAGGKNVAEAINKGIEDVMNHPRILDSGNRRQFESGAVRDIQEGKGRCDLLPLDVVSEYFSYATIDHAHDVILMRIARFQETGFTKELFWAINNFVDAHWDGNHLNMLLELAIHFEEGAKKYGDNNWRKGIPVRCYIDSGVRHYLKFLRGDKDEPHDRAFCWNMMCAIWTCKHHPELNDYHDVDRAIKACNHVIKTCDDALKRMEEVKPVGEFDNTTAEKFWGEADTNG